MTEEKKYTLEDYEKDVQWLREHVPPDDIYDFAEQMIISAECMLLELAKNIDIFKKYDEDIIFRQYFDNIHSISSMRNNGFNGIIDVSVKERDTSSETGDISSEKET